MDKKYGNACAISLRGRKFHAISLHCSVSHQNGEKKEMT